MTTRYNELTADFAKGPVSQPGFVGSRIYQTRGDEKHQRVLKELSQLNLGKSCRRVRKQALTGGVESPENTG